MICDICKNNWGDTVQRRVGQYKGKKVCDTCNMKTDQWQKTLEKYRDKAYKYYSYCNICPDGEDILNFVVNCIEDESGYKVNEDNERSIAQRLNIKI